MKKFLNYSLMLLIIISALFLSFSLVACDSLNATEKAAQAYISEHAEDYTSFTTKSGLKYTETIDHPSIGIISFDGAYTLIYDFKTKKGTCSASLASDEYLFTFTSNYDYETQELTFNVNQVTKNANDNILSTLESMVKAKISSAYATVAEAATK